MVRSKKLNPSEEIAQAFDAPIDLDWGVEAQKLDIPVPQLQERMASKLGDIVHSWELIPHEHQPLLEGFKRDLEAESSVRRLTTSEPALEPPETPVEPPLIEEESQPKKRGGRPKKESTAITKRKSTALKESDQKAQQLAGSDQQVKVALHARKGQKSGAQLATIELAAEDLTYRKIKGEALVRKTAQLTSEIASESNFDPIQVLAELGIDSNTEIFEDLRQQLEPAGCIPNLQKYQGAITANCSFSF